MSDKQVIDENKDSLIPSIETDESEVTGIDKSSLEGKTPEQIKSLLGATRIEAAQKRLIIQDLQKVIKSYEKDKEKQELEKKITEGKKDEAIIELQKKLADQEKDFEPVKEKAKKYDDYDAAKRADLKSKLGESWMESFNTMALIELEKLAPKLDPNIKLVDTDNGTNKKKTEGEFFSWDELNALTNEQLKNKDILAKANKSMEHHSKK